MWQYGTWNCIETQWSEMHNWWGTINAMRPECVGCICMLRALEKARQKRQAYLTWNDPTRLSALEHSSKFRLCHDWVVWSNRHNNHGNKLYVGVTSIVELIIWEIEPCLGTRLAIAMPKWLHINVTLVCSWLMINDTSLPKNVHFEPFYNLVLLRHPSCCSLH